MILEYFLILTLVGHYQIMLLFLFYDILTALNRILNYEGCRFTISNDSRSVLEVLRSFNPVYPLILEMLEWIFLIN